MRSTSKMKSMRLTEWVPSEAERRRWNKANEAMSNTIKTKEKALKESEGQIS